jgi:acyl-CoA synthetase (AMP-forming)/AMP-acid ligase II
MIEFSYENLSDCVFHHAEVTPDAPALYQGREVVSYGALAALVRQAAVYLKHAGIGPQDRVGIALSNSIERVALAWALMRMGAVGIELPEEASQADLNAYTKRFAMAAMLTEPGCDVADAKLHLRIDLNWRDEVAALAGDARFAGDAAELMLLNLSSGSTGHPKGIMCTHQARLVRSRMTLNANEFYRGTPAPLLLAAPASTNLTWGVLVNHLVIGWPVVLLPTYKFIGALVREAARWEQAILPVPPGMARQMLDYAPARGLLFAKMRALVTAGQAIASHDKVALMEKATPNVFEFYGSGGIGMLTCIGPEEAKREPKSVGRPVPYPGVEVEIAGPDGKRLGQGAIGQLRVRGPNTATHFFVPEDNLRGTERFIDGWYYPGEVASLSKTGYLVLEGRIADAIKTGNIVIYPQEIEDVMLEHKAVSEAAVVGRAGPQGEDIVAFVVGRPGYKHAEIIEHCKKKLSVSKRPRFIYYLDALPKTGNGKVDRAALKTVPLKRVEPV